MNTNWVEGLHSIRRKYADKRLNFARTYSTRANIALLSGFIKNWQSLLLTKLQIYTGEHFKMQENVTFTNKTY